MTPIETSGYTYCTVGVLPTHGIGHGAEFTAGKVSELVVS